jgi:site-specific DNA-cytosine methylase
MANILIACEYSGVVRDAFAKLGHNAVSVDYLPSESPGNHIQGDVLDVIRSKQWDLMIAFPPCTHLAVSGARYFEAKRADGRQQEALAFVEALLSADIRRIALENPVGVISSHIRKPDQIIQPWMFGEDASKKTCLWLKGLPKLEPTKVITKDRYANQTPSGQNNLGPSEDRWKVRSRSYRGVAEAMAAQWGWLTQWR